MQWLKNCWYMAAWADEIPHGASLVRTIVDVPLLFWRDDDGNIFALHDRCAHRLAPLSRGRLEGAVVRCGYHGLAYDGATGRCVENPHGPVTSTLAVRSYPVVERHGVVWLWVGESFDAEPAMIPDLSFATSTPATAFSKGYMPTAADHRLLEDNILDLSHGDYLHADTLGGGSFTRAKITVEERHDSIWIRWLSCNEKAIPIWQTELPDPNMAVDMSTEVTWFPSGVMLLDSWMVPAGGFLGDGLITRNAHIMTPETGMSTHYFYCNSRNYRVEDAAYNAALAVGLAGAFGGEDKPMIEAQQSRIGERDLLDCGPALLAIDNASTRARRMYQRLLARECADA